MTNLYMLPEEIALAKELRFAVNKYDLLKDDTLGLSTIIGENNNWIVDGNFISILSQRVRENVETKIIGDKKDLNYLQNLSERIMLQCEIVGGATFPFDVSSVKPEYYTNIKSKFYPIMQKHFKYRFNTMQDKYKTFIALEYFNELRPYLKDIQPYLNHMTSTHIPTKNNYRPLQIEFALPILYEIQKAKEMNIPEKLIQDSIGHLNENKITSPEHFKAVLKTVTLMKENKETEKIPIEHKKSIPKDIQSAIDETVKNIKKTKIGMPLTQAQISVLEKAQNPELVKEIGNMMSKRYVSNEVALAIVDNVNAISKVNPDVSVSHLTQTLSLVGQLSRMTPKEMNILGDLISNDKDNLSFYNIREKASRVKENNISKVWNPNRNVETPKQKEKEFATMEK